MITAMHHSGVVVLDLDRAVEFYRDAIGLKLRGTFEFADASTAQVVGYEDVKLKTVEMETPDGQMIELLQYLHPPAPRRPSDDRSLQGASHLAFRVKDIDKTFGALISKGGIKLNPPVEESAGVKVCYLQDPEGNWIELVEENG